MNRPRWPYVGLALAVLWLFVRGVSLPYGHPIEALSNVVAEFLIGLVVGGVIAYGFRRMYAPRMDLGQTFSGLVPAIRYLALFLWELVTANLDVAARVLKPHMPIHPAVIELPLRVESDLAITTIANSITLTPGTLTMDYDEEKNALYVHAIACHDPDEVVEPIRAWEDYALLIFDEDKRPGDPAEPPVVSLEPPGGDGDGR